VEIDWRLDERASAGAEHLDPAYVSSYERKSPTDWGAEVAALLAAGVGSSSTVVDFGAGTGSFARALSPHVARVVCVDISGAMVGAMLAHGFEAVRAGFLTYEHQGEAPDAVYTRNALHHLPDFWKVIALDRIARMIRPGGVFRLRDLAYSFDPAETDDAVRAWLRDAPEDPATGWTARELANHVRGEHSTFTWLLESMLERVGFEIRDRWQSQDRMYAAYTCLRP
jgi:SAM-dependent methyltransferase